MKKIYILILLILSNGLLGQDLVFVANDQQSEYRPGDLIEGRFILKNKKISEARFLKDILNNSQKKVVIVEMNSTVLTKDNQLEAMGLVIPKEELSTDFSFTFKIDENVYTFSFSNMSVRGNVEVGKEFTFGEEDWWIIILWKKYKKLWLILIGFLTLGLVYLSTKGYSYYVKRQKAKELKKQQLTLILKFEKINSKDELTSFWKSKEAFENLFKEEKSSLNDFWNKMGDIPFYPQLTTKDLEKLNGLHKNLWSTLKGRYGI